MLYNIPLLLGLFSETTSGRNKNSTSFVKRNLLLTFLLSIMFRKSSNPLLRPSSNYDKLRKRKSRAILISRSLKDLSYITDKSKSQGAFTMIKSNIISMESFW